MELALFAIALGIALVPLLRGASTTPGAARILAAAAAVFAIVGATLWSPPDRTVFERTPGPVADGGFATSDSCRSCHPGEHASWHRSFHRTMTQRALAETVLGDFDDVTLSDRGRTYQLTREADGFFVELSDPVHDVRKNEPGYVAPRQIARIKARIVMTTGSHHLQAYWFRHRAFFAQLPFVWHINDQRWIPSLDSFLRPQSAEPVEIQVWNTSCVYCHSVGGQPHTELFPTEAADTATRAVELGIACEACHGPAEEHVRACSDPGHRYGLHFAEQDVADIVNPAKLDHVRGSEVCGQCHSVNTPTDVRRWLSTGPDYRAGNQLGATQTVIRANPGPNASKVLTDWLESNREGNFWPDGTIRVAGREYNGLVESPCYQRGTMSCMSCHSMHDSEPADQLSRDMHGNAACLQCHAEFAGDALAAHTHHAPDSAGSQCYNCHMPHTTWGLFVAMRAHRVDSPSAKNSVETGRPNACNQCHIDKPLAWTADKLTDWFGQAHVEIDGEHATTAASVVWLLRGDAPQRAIAAWTMGWTAAHEASGNDWQAPLLAELLDDPYSAVRYVASRSLRSLPRLGDLEFDYVGTADARRSVRDRVIEHRADSPREDAALLRGPGGALDRAAVRRFLERRDDRPVAIIE